MPDQRSEKALYIIINIAVLLMAGFLFLMQVVMGNYVITDDSLYKWIVLLFVVVFVHILKASRLYFIMYGFDISLSDFIKTYCKVTPVSVIFPYKLGEFYRMYCYGNCLGSLFKGVIVVLVDRFMDTLALLTIVIAGFVIYGGQITGFVFLLLLFVLIVIIVYLTFSNVLSFWKKRLIQASATKERLRLLDMLDNSLKIYREVEGICLGKSMIMYVLSLVSWGIEIGGFLLISSSGETENGRIVDYLSAALGLSSLPELNRFVFVTIVLLLVVYILLKVRDIGKRIHLLTIR